MPIGHAGHDEPGHLFFDGLQLLLPMFKTLLYSSIISKDFNLSFIDKSVKHLKHAIAGSHASNYCKAYVLVQESKSLYFGIAGESWWPLVGLYARLFTFQMGVGTAVMASMG